MIRMPRANKQNLKYSLYKEKSVVEKVDANGNKLYVEVKGKKQPITMELPPHYEEPIDFKASIQMSGGNTEPVEFGIDISSYSAIITTPKGMLPITETSIIWFESDVKHKKDGSVDDASADYSVVKKTSSLYYDRYVLAKRVNNV